jgi:hypothetical protein
MAQFVESQDEENPERLLRQVQARLDHQDRRQRRRWLAAACVAGLVGAGVVIGQQLGTPDAAPEPADTVQHQVLREPGTDPPGLPAFQLGLRRVGVLEVPPDSQVSVSLAEAGADGSTGGHLRCCGHGRHGSDHGARRRRRTSRHARLSAGRPVVHACLPRCPAHRGCAHAPE